MRLQSDRLEINHFGLFPLV
eukprot:gene22466-28592_t